MNAVTLWSLMKDDSDENLMQRYQNDDTAAFEVLYSRHKAALYRYFVRQCPDTMQAEELYQDLWMSIIKSRHRYVVSAKFTTYMYTIAHNKLIDYYRRNKLRFSDEMNNNDNSNNTPIDEIPSQAEQQPENIVEIEQKRSHLLTAVNLLPESQREVFLLREELGLSLEEIAKITQVNKETAKSRLRYAVNSLKKSIAQVIHE